MKCRLHRPVVVFARKRLVMTFCERCGCYQRFETGELIMVGDRFRWRDVS